MTRKIPGVDIDMNQDSARNMRTNAEARLGICGFWIFAVLLFPVLFCTALFALTLSVASLVFR
jgi:hypothetical protein